MRRIWLIFSQAVTVAVAIVFVLGTFKPQWLRQEAGRWTPTAAPSPQPAAASAPTGVAVQMATDPLPEQALSAAAQRAAPAVVSVTASKSQPNAAANPHAQDPFFEFFLGRRGQKGAPPEPEPMLGMGSGVLVSVDGYLLTNNHVVDRAEKIQVRLADGRELSATLVGTDPETDLAVLKLALTGLPAVTLGQMDQVRIGDTVLAIGNPFNVGQTVTSGIVSALGRDGLGLSTFENFIQTDAAINPGNSGGALVDVHGHLIGINTAIYSRSGGSMGIGFAIPVDLARQVMDALVRDGRVTRGWIGVQTRELDADTAHSLDLPVNQGVLISGVLRDGPASKAGMAPGDVVTQINGQAITHTSQLLRTVAALKPQSQARIQLVRQAKSVVLTVQVAQRPAPEQLER